MGFSPTAGESLRGRGGGFVGDGGRVFDDNDGRYLGGEYGFSIGEYDAAWFLRYGRADSRLHSENLVAAMVYGRK